MKLRKFVFKPEKLKLSPSTFGFVKLYLSGLPALESLSICGPAGYFKPITLPDLSKASPAASSKVSPKTCMSKGLFTLTIWVWPPEIVSAKKGKSGLSLSGSCIKWAKMCACIWFTAIKGMSKAKDIDLAKDVPTINDPTNPGPFVKATADKSLILIPASLITFSTTGRISFWCSLEANSGTTPPYNSCIDWLATTLLSMTESEITAAAVSSHEDSIPRMYVFLVSTLIIKLKKY